MLCSKQTSGTKIEAESKKVGMKKSNSTLVEITAGQMTI
jgi:hypothetical protein